MIESGGCVNIVWRADLEDRSVQPSPALRVVILFRDSRSFLWLRIDIDKLIAFEQTGAHSEMLSLGRHPHDFVEPRLLIRE
jgi:hypothetical protein